MNPYLLQIMGAFVINVPLGHMRAKARKFSWTWFFWIHASIPIIIYLRFALKISPWFIPVSIVAAVMGQIVGSRLWPTCRQPKPFPKILSMKN